MPPSIMDECTWRYNETASPHGWDACKVIYAGLAKTSGQFIRHAGELALDGWLSQIIPNNYEGLSM